MNPTERPSVIVMASSQSSHSRSAFTLLEVLVVIGIISLLTGILVPALSNAREAGRSTVCLANQRQIGLAARMYMDDYEGQMFHHHEGWVLDDGTQVEDLPPTPAGCEGGGMGNSQAEKPWVIFFQPYLKSRTVGFCPSDPTPRSNKLTETLDEYNGAITSTGEELPAQSELSIAEENHLTLVSYLLNSIFTHKSARYAVEGALDGFATDSRIGGLKNRELVIFSERNSEAMNASDNDAYRSVGQDDYDTWVGEAALVRWGDEAGDYADEGWIKYNRHKNRANYIYEDGHAVSKKWSAARWDQFPDRNVRKPLDNPPL